MNWNLKVAVLVERHFRKRGWVPAVRWRAVLDRQNADLAVTLGRGGLQAP